MKHITDDYLVQTCVYLCLISNVCSRSETVLPIFMQVITALPYSMGRPSFQWGEGTELPGRLYFNPLSISRSAGRVGLIRLGWSGCGSELKTFKWFYVDKKKSNSANFS